jgi:hypothetical protein
MARYWTAQSVSRNPFKSFKHEYQVNRSKILISVTECDIAKTS